MLTRLVFLFLVAVAARSPQHDLSGVWVNQLGSVMNITGLVQSDNWYSFGGTYVSRVGDAKGPYPIVGRGIFAENAHTYVFTWNVVWNGANFTTDSITSWNGYWDTPQSYPQITANWILTYPGFGVWRSTLSGQDIFLRKSRSMVRHLA